MEPRGTRDGRRALDLAFGLYGRTWVVLDISIPEIKAAEVARVLLSERPECRIVVLTVHEDRATVRLFLDLGVSGYIIKRLRGRRSLFVRSVRSSAGGIYLDHLDSREGRGQVAPKVPPTWVYLAALAMSRLSDQEIRRAAPDSQRLQQQGDRVSARHQCQDSRDS